MGSQPDLGRECVRFGVFELNIASGELRKHGTRVRLQEQPLKLLVRLLEVPGEIRSREDLIRQIWPEGTFVDYERGLNAAVTRLRQALADSADSPRYVETVGRKGYRFIAPVECIAPVEHSRAVAGSDAQPLEGNTSSRTQSLVEPQMNLVAPDRPRRQKRAPIVWSHVAVFVVGIAAGVFTLLWRGAALSPQPLAQLSIELEPHTLAGSPGTTVAISPDGRLLAIVVHSADNGISLATRRLDEDLLTPLPGTEGAASPFFSPDGQWIAFFADNKLKKIPVQGGAPVTLAEAATYPGPGTRFPAGSWGDDGNIIAMLNSSAGLSRIPVTGGSPVALSRLKRAAEEVDNWPQVLPGSEAVLFTRHSGDFDSGSIEVLSFQTGVRKTILKPGFFGRYLPSGHLIFIRENRLFAVRFDLKKLACVGVPRQVLENIANPLGSWSFDFSNTGIFAFSRPRAPRYSIFSVDRAGRQTPIPLPPADTYTGPRFSPDGKRLAISIGARGHQDIWVYDIVRGTAMRLTALPGANDTPVWTTDGNSIIFRSVEHSTPGIYVVSADGSGEAKRLTDFRAGEFPYSISPDGKHLALWDRRAGGAIWTVPVEISPRTVSMGKPEPFVETRFNPAVPGRLAPVFSPDGRWLAYCSNDSGQLEVYVAAFPGPGRRMRVSTHGGKFPVWDRHGRRLFFLDLGSNRLMAAKYEEKGDSLLAGMPQVWSDKRLLDLGRPQSYDVAPDGSRYAAVLFVDGTAEQKPLTSMTVMLNFFDDLRRRLPTHE